MRIKNQHELLDETTRKKLIEEMNGPENLARKAEAFRRYQCLKDRTRDYTLAQLKKQFDQSTIDEMEYAIANVSLVRKCIDKLSKVYSYGVNRVIKTGSKKDDKATIAVQELSKSLKLNTQMKQANKYLKLQRNCMVYVKPCPTDLGWDIKVQPLSPFLYDVIEHYYDRTKPMAVILSDYNVVQSTYTINDAAIRSSREASQSHPGDGKDQGIADTPTDAESKGYVWWTDSYHFTTDETGKIISDPENLENPIGELPMVNLAIDQDEQFWAVGGSDLVDGAILINSVLTHNQHIATTQGYGQFWMRGKNLPRNVKIGPSKAILMEHLEGEPQPDIGFASSNPPLDSLRGLVEQYIALLLTTNNLSTSSVSSQLSGGMSAPSGVALIIDKAESIEDVNEQREVFAQAEPMIWRKIAKFMEVLGSSLTPELKETPVDVDLVSQMTTKYNEPPSIQSESEKLNNIKLRKDLGINTLVDLILKDNPDMSNEEAEFKLAEILKEKIAVAMGVESKDTEDSEDSMELPNDEEPTEANPEQDMKNQPQQADIQKQALNGAQVSSLIELVGAVASGAMPRDSAVEIVQLAFQTDKPSAEKLLASAGRGFTPTAPMPNNGN